MERLGGGGVKGGRACIFNSSVLWLIVVFGPYLQEFKGHKEFGVMGKGSSYKFVD